MLVVSCIEKEGSEMEPGSSELELMFTRLIAVLGTRHIIFGREHRLPGGRYSTRIAIVISTSEVDTFVIRL
jgi:hypothetical protein